MAPKPLVVVAGSFNPPCNHHQMLIQGAKKVAESIGSSFLVYLCPGGLLSEEKQEAYFAAAFPNVEYKKVNSSPFPGDDIYVVGETLQVFQLSESIEIPKITAEIHVEAASGNYYSFKSHLPLGMKDVEARKLMNDIRESLGHARLDFSRRQNVLRDSYIKGESWKVGQIVECEGQHLTIAKRGTNYLVCTDDAGRVVQKWLHEVNEICAD